MKIGIDFGTSNSSAAALVNGQIRHIQFNGEPQFKTTVFIPHNQVDESEFHISPADEEQIRRMIQTARSGLVRYMQDYNRALKTYMDWKDSKAKDPREPPRIKPKKPVIPSDEKLRDSAVQAIKRQWIQEKTEFQNKATNVRLDDAFFGEEAIDQFFAEGEGRLIQSPKSMLGFKLGEPQLKAITGIVSRILEHIRIEASLQLGCEITSATIGRPVEFRGVSGPAGTVQAIDLLTQAAKNAGFESVDFLSEPSAGAIGYHIASETKHLAVIVDIGGGTTDVAFAHIGGDTSRPEVIKAWGLTNGGTDVDESLSLYGLMPLFGKGRTSTLGYHFVNAVRVSDLNRQLEFQNTDFSITPNPYKNRLLALQQPGYTIIANRDVEALKVDLSYQGSSSKQLNYIENGLRMTLIKDDLEIASTRFIEKLNVLLSEVSNETLTLCPVVFLTGGMTRAPYVIETVKQHFPGCTVIAGDASLGIVNGLAIYAALISA